MPKAAIAIDAWKLDIFRRHLTQAGYSYTSRPFTQDTLMLSVATENLEALAGVIKAANIEAARTGAPT